MPLDLDAAVFRAVATTIVPEAAALDAAGWRELEGIVEAMGSTRSEALRRQLRIFVRAIQWLPVLRYGKPFTRLSPAARTAVLEHLENDAVHKVRVGFWGLRTMIMAGYYGRPAAAAAIGYAASPHGWESLP